jgi:L-alanine-DL-glutamate epimerase-like enolase superfamily enzyme
MEVGMKIRGLEVIPFRIQCEYLIRISAGVMDAVQNVLVKILTDTGIVGLGEMRCLLSLQGCSETQGSVSEITRKAYVRVLFGHAPANIEKILEDLDSTGRGNFPALTAVGDAFTTFWPRP